jgi:hypothetical protein
MRASLREKHVWAVFCASKAHHISNPEGHPLRGASFTKERKSMTDTALQYLLQQTKNGAEFPDAAYDAAQKFNVSQPELEASYDQHFLDQEALARQPKRRHPLELTLTCDIDLSQFSSRRVSIAKTSPGQFFITSSLKFYNTAEGSEFISHYLRRKKPMYKWSLGVCSAPHGYLYN